MKTIKEILADLGFTAHNAGGNCMALAKTLPDGCQVLVSDCDGGIEFGCDDWCVTKHDPTTGDEVQAHWRDGKDNYEPLHGARTILEALRECGVDITACGDDYVTPLVDEFQAYCDQHGLPQESADELFYSLEGEQRAKHRKYLLDFITRWESTMTAIYGR